MRTLKKEEKDLLKSLVDNRWFKLLEELVWEFEQDVLMKLKTLDVTNEKDLKILWKNQIYLKGVEDFLITIKSQTNSIQRKDFS